MKIKCFCFFLLCLTVSCKINQKKNGVEVGKWKYISGTKTEKTVVKGKYDKYGREKGVWNYYNNDTLFRSEKYFYPYAVNVLYHKNGKINEVGKSYTTHKTWTKIGTWYYFNENEKLTDSVTFENDKTPLN